MMVLEKEEMLKITGGGISAWGIFGIIAALIFGAGIVDGFARPLPCNK